VKWPNKVRIKARVHYEIVWTDEFVDAPDNRGECRFDTKQIVLLRGMADGPTFETLIHELLHAIEFEYEIKMPHASIYALEGAIHAILKYNGWYPKQPRKKRGT
jgi:hypothetical protein